MTPLPASSSSARPRSWWAWLALLLVVTGTAVWWAGQGTVPPPAETPTVARRTLEVRDARFFLPGSPTAFTGEVTDHYEGGALKLRTEVVDGRLHGESVGWFTNGVRELTEHFRQGLPHGVRTTWHENGRKRSEGELVDGRQQGIYRQWHENGQLAAEASFAEGKPHGLSLAWHPDGSLKAEAMMEHGEVLSRQVHPAGVRWEPSALPGDKLPLSTAQSK